MPIADLIKISAGLFGLIFGVIFLSDGWYGTSDASGVGGSPKIRGLLFLLGGSVIPIFTDFFSPAGEEVRGYATVMYAIILALTTLIGVIILAIYAFLVSVSRIHDLVPSRHCIKISIDALPFVFKAVRKGSASFYEELNKKYNNDRIEQLCVQRDETLSLFNGIYQAMVDNNIKHISGVENFVEFVEEYLKYFIEEFVIPKKDKVVYRACIYFHDQDKIIDSDSDGDTKLYYLVGFDPTKKTKFSKASFDYRDSFAGWVISRSTDRSQVYSYVRDGENSFQGKKIPWVLQI